MDIKNFENGARMTKIRIFKVGTQICEACCEINDVAASGPFIADQASHRMKIRRLRSTPASEVGYAQRTSILSGSDASASQQCEAGNLIRVTPSVTEGYA